ncbi:leucyl aminopeptidase [Candidatus Babeliales bacterium]|nr:leucyl aminopeptidase [Candidatus Babeliales bacterium]
MICLTLSSKTVTSANAHAYALCVYEGFSVTKDISATVHAKFPILAQAVKQKAFKGSAQTHCVVSALHNKKLIHIILVGMGKKRGLHCTLESYRRALGKLIRTAECYKLTSIALQIPEASCFKESYDDVIQHTATTLHMADYRFDRFTKDKPSKIKRSITLCVGSYVTQVKKALSVGEVIGEAVNNARMLIDTPPSDLTPAVLAKHAESIARQHNISCKVLSEEQIKKMGMGGLAAVSAGSEQDCKLIIMEYKVSAKAPTVALIGKGITFDSGGLSLKPANAMETMKEDMSGAAAVISAMQAIAQLQPKVNVVMVAPAAENLPSGAAAKPGDIITFYNGKTAEVRNTDAEGRLILADALSYAVKHYEPDFMIDLATLTGACQYALGPFFTGMFSKHDSAARRVEVAAHSSGDRVWRFPMDDDYLPAIQTPVADICNIGKPAYKAGATTAAFFLHAFVGTTPWVHLDIAGTAFDVPGMSYYRTGATGAGVRLLIDLVMNWK